MFTLKFQSEDMKEALAVLSRVINKSASMPILERVVLTACPDRTLSLMASDGVTWLQNSIRCEVDGIPAPIAVMPAWLKGILPQSEGEATISLQVKSYKGSYDLIATTCDTRIAGTALGVEEYPDYMPLGNKTANFKYDRHMLVSAIKAVSFATATDSSNPLMQGILIEDDEDGYTSVVATDGRMLVRKKVLARLGDTSNRYQCVLPKSLIGALTNISGSDSMTITQYYNEKPETDLAPAQLIPTESVVIRMGNVVVYSSVLEGRYPRYKSVMLDLERCCKATTSRASLLSSLKRASNFGNTNSCLFCLIIKEDRIEVQASDYDYSTESRDTIPAITTTDKPCVIGASSYFAQRVLNAASGNNVRIYFTAPNCPIAIVGADENLYLLLMPMQVDYDPTEQKEESEDEPVEETTEEESSEEPVDETTDEEPQEPFE